MNLSDFFDQFGVSAIVRRHFGYRKPVTDQEIGSSVRGALTYTRNLDDRKLGLTFPEAAKAFEQGKQLVAMGIVPQIVITGDNQRNWDGGNCTSEAIQSETSKLVPVWTSPAVTYPHYVNYELTRSEYDGPTGDYAPHRYLAGKSGQIWSEPPSVFEARLTAAVHADYGVIPVLFDLNFEQLTLLHFIHVQGLSLDQIPCTKGTWIPTMGGGVVYSADRKVAKEFRPDLTIVE